MRELPKYRCIKDVWALKITAVVDPSKPNEETDGSRELHFAEEGYGPLHVDAAYVRKHNPQAGGYYVQYADGYTSWSPAKAFEEGYVLIGGK